MWTIIAYIIIGVLGGAIAKAIMPGKQGGGFWMTALLGIIGALLGGFLGQFLIGKGFDEIFSIAGLICSIVGSLVILFLFGLINKNKA